MNRNYVYDDEMDERTQSYWQGRDDGREEEGGGLAPVLVGLILGSLTVGALWALTSMLS